jgi:hypothetical protein
MRNSASGQRILRKLLIFPEKPQVYIQSRGACFRQTLQSRLLLPQSSAKDRAARCAVCAWPSAPFLSPAEFGAIARGMYARYWRLRGIYIALTPV